MEKVWLLVYPVAYVGAPMELEWTREGGLYGVTLEGAPDPIVAPGETVSRSELHGTNEEAELVKVHAVLGYNLCVTIEKAAVAVGEARLIRELNELLAMAQR